MKINESGYQIRVARVEELPLLSDLEQSAASRFRDTSYAFLVDADSLPLEFVQERHQVGHVWVAIDRQNEVVGYAIAREVDETLYLQEIDVVPSQGRRGIGSALVKTVCTVAIEQGYDIVSLSTFRDIPWNAPFYAKLGFCPVDESDLSMSFQQIRRKESEAGLPIIDRIIMYCKLVSPSLCSDAGRTKDCNSQSL